MAVYNAGGKSYVTNGYLLTPVFSPDHWDYGIYIRNRVEFIISSKQERYVTPTLPLTESIYRDAKMEGVVHIPPEHWAYICWAIGSIAGWASNVSSSVDNQTRKISGRLSYGVRYRWPEKWWPELGIFKQASEGIGAYELALWMYGIMQQTIYRVEFTRTGNVNIFSWGLVENEERDYRSPDALPQWMQEKIAVLMILDPNEVNADMPDVGKRISQNIFWVYGYGDNRLGNDTGTPRKESRT